MIFDQLKFLIASWVLFSERDHEIRHLAIKLYSDIILFLSSYVILCHAMLCQDILHQDDILVLSYSYLVILCYAMLRFLAPGRYSTNILLFSGYAMLCCAMTYYAVPCYAMLRHLTPERNSTNILLLSDNAMLCCVMLCYETNFFRTSRQLFVISYIFVLSTIHLSTVATICYRL